MILWLIVQNAVKNCGLVDMSGSISIIALNVMTIPTNQSHMFQAVIPIVAILKLLDPEQLIAQTVQAAIPQQLLPTIIVRTLSVLIATIRRVTLILILLYVPIIKMAVANTAIIVLIIISVVIIASLFKNFVQIFKNDRKLELQLHIICVTKFKLLKKNHTF